MEGGLDPLPLAFPTVGFAAVLGSWTPTEAQNSSPVGIFLHPQEALPAAS